MYSFLAPSEKAAIFRQFTFANEKKLEQSLKTLILFRNTRGVQLLAHRTRSVLLGTALRRKLGIGNRGRYTQGKSDPLAVSIAPRHLLPKDRFLAFERKFAKSSTATWRRAARSGGALCSIQWASRRTGWRSRDANSSTISSQKNKINRRDFDSAPVWLTLRVPFRHAALNGKQNYNRGNESQIRPIFKKSSWALPFT